MGTRTSKGVILRRGDRLIVDVAIAGLPLHRTFSYTCEHSVPIGTRVLVDFRGRRSTAYVIGESEAPPKDIRLKNVVRVVDSEPLVSERDVKVAIKVSEAFLAPMGKVMDLYFSGFGEFSTIQVVKQTEDDSERKPVWEWLQTHGLHRARRLAADAKLRIEAVQKAPLSSTKRRRLVELIASINELAGLKFGEKQAKVINYLSMKPCEDLQVLLTRLGVERRTIDSLEKRGIVKVKEETLAPWVEQKRVKLTAAQRNVKNRIESDFYSPHLIMGVTGSGKTEVYFELIEKVLAQGKNALLLVPEISLTPQIIARVRGRFPQANVYPYHSHLSKRERALVWWKAVIGESRMIVVGTRSALWIPMHDLGIVVIDEEHDESYYQTAEPCYDAAVVARIKATIYGIPLILSSASPSLSTYHAAIGGDIKLHRLKERPVGSMPQVKLIDMRRKKPEERIISYELSRFLEKTLESGKVALVLAMRKAFANYVACARCGYVFKCPRCDIGLSYHRSGKLLKCHHCGYTVSLPGVCPECGSKELSSRGYGTERVEYELIRRFPTARILRFDRENVTSPTETEHLIKEIVDGNCDIVVGTRLISKGLDAPNVNLVAVVDADRNLSIPSFSSRETLFQLLIQMSGRSGRRDHGVSLIQTLEPEDEFFKFVKANDYEGFAQFEMEKRRVFRYPPFSTLIRVIASSPDPLIAREALGRLSSELLQMGLEVLGPTEAPLPKIRGEYRFHVMLKLDSAKFQELSKRLADLLDKIEGSGIRVNCFVNPRTTFP